MIMAPEQESIKRIREALSSKIDILEDDFDFKDVDIVERALLEKQLSEKFTEIVIKKEVEIGYLKGCFILKDYNMPFEGINENKLLTQKEFNFLRNVVAIVERGE